MVVAEFYSLCPQPVVQIGHELHEEARRVLDPIGKNRRVTQFVNQKEQDIGLGAGNCRTVACSQGSRFEKARQKPAGGHCSGRFEKVSTLHFRGPPLKKAMHVWGWTKNDEGGLNGPKTDRSTGKEPGSASF